MRNREDTLHFLVPSNHVPHFRHPHNKTNCLSFQKRVPTDSMNSIHFVNPIATAAPTEKKNQQNSLPAEVLVQLITGLFSIFDVINSLHAGLADVMVLKALPAQSNFRLLNILTITSLSFIIFLFKSITSFSS